MSTTEVHSETTVGTPRARMVDMKLEVVVIPVADVDRAKRFYGGLGWRLDADFVVGDAFRVVQFTPPGSPCSIHFGNKVTAATPGSVQNTYLVVSDIEAARTDLTKRGVDVSGTFHFTEFGGKPVPGADPDGRSYSSLATFKDPDGNGWLLQEIKVPLPGRGFATDVDSVTAVLKEAEKHHGAYEPTAPKHHWSDWYAAYVVARERGKTELEAVAEATHHTEAVPA